MSPLSIELLTLISFYFLSVYDLEAPSPSICWSSICHWLQAFPPEGRRKNKKFNKYEPTTQNHPLFGTFPSLFFWTFFFWYFSIWCWCWWWCWCWAGSSSALFWCFKWNQLKNFFVFRMFAFCLLPSACHLPDLHLLFFEWHLEFSMEINFFKKKSFFLSAYFLLLSNILFRLPLSVYFSIMLIIFTFIFYFYVFIFFR